VRKGSSRPHADLARPPILEPRHRTLDEKLDEALKLTFPASDAFVIV